MPKKPPPLLTKKKQSWMLQFKPNVMRGAPLNFNVAVQERYEKKLTRLTRMMSDETKREVTKLMRGDDAQLHMRPATTAMDASVASQARILMNALTSKFEQLFNSKAQGLAEDMVDDSDAASKSSLHSSLKELSGGLSIKTDIVTGPLKNVMKASIAENVGLIKSIPQQYLKQVQGAVMRSITTGNGLEDLIPKIEKYDGMTHRRAKNIALDQTRKAYNNINKGRMDAVGIQQFEWLHSGGGQKPRAEHLAMSGNIYDMANPPVIDSKTGERGFPAQLPNCGCRMLPVIKFNEVPQE